MNTDFNLELAKSGKSVYTRDGRSVRIICYDCANEGFPIVALIEDDSGDGELIQSYTIDGHYYEGDVSDDDLVMHDSDRYYIALERAKNLIKNGNLSEDATKCLSKVFDEIGANGYDEMVINALISVLKSDFEEETAIDGITVGNIISWLYSKKKKIRCN